MEFQLPYSLCSLFLLTCCLHGGTASPISTPASEPRTPEPAGAVEKFSRPALNLRYTYDADMNFDKLRGRLSLQEAEITLPLSPLVTGELTVLSDLYYRSYQLDVDTPSYKADLDLQGLNDFLNPQPYLEMMPPCLPEPCALNLLSGGAEIAGGLGVLIPKYRGTAGWGLIALLIAVFPANLHVALNGWPGVNLQPWVLWARLPCQLLFIEWVYFTCLTNLRAKAAWKRSPQNNY